MAFSPGHVTGFFQILDDEPDPAKVGSRGAGFSIRHGVTSRVRIVAGAMPGVSVKVDGKPFDATTTRRAAEILCAGQEIHVDVEQRMDLPVSQGFGMSSAGALSTALALAHCLGQPRSEAVRAAHVAEVVQRTGLGDVVGADAGGFEVRVRPGLPPGGEVRQWVPEPAVDEVLLAVVADAVSTKKVLSDPVRRKEINAAGANQVEAFLRAPSFSSFIEGSRVFARSGRLVPPAMRGLWEELGDGLAAGQCQLGGSLFVFGAPPKVQKALEARGPVFVTRIDPEGARLIPGPQ